MTKWEKMIKELNEFQKEMLDTVKERIKEEVGITPHWHWMGEHIAEPLCSRWDCEKHSQGGCEITGYDVIAYESLCYPTVVYLMGKTYDFIKKEQQEEYDELA